MAIVQIQQFDAHLADAPKLEWVTFGTDRRARATFVAISNDVRGSGAERRERATAILWTAWGAAAEAHAAHLGKGSHVNVLGRIERTRRTDSESGEPVYGYAFTAEAVHYLDTHQAAEARRRKHVQST
jgi:single-strand DNA-binding protein